MRRCFIHIGTHKTGTTTLQDMLTRNASALAQAGVHVVRTGRAIELAGTEFIANQNFAWELLEDPRFDARYGTVSDLNAELHACAASSAVVSSEDFCFTYDRPLELARLRDACLEAGFVPVVIVYLREQSSYAASLYDMYVTKGRLTITFDRYIVCMLEEATIGWDDFRAPFTLEYDRLLEPYVRCFGTENVIARPYRREAGSVELTAEFLTHVAPEHAFDFEHWMQAPRLNTGNSFLDVMRTLHRNYEAFLGTLPTVEHIAREQAIALETLETPFAPVGPIEAVRFRDRFLDSNVRLKAIHGVDLACSIPEDSPVRRAQDRLLRACSQAWDPR